MTPTVEEELTLYKPDGTVVSEMSRGFKIHDRVLRPSKVVVSIKPATS